MPVRWKNGLHTTLHWRSQWHMIVGMVWMVDPEARDLSVCRPGQEPRLLSADDSLTAEDILPGFPSAIARIFSMPGQ